MRAIGLWSILFTAIVTSSVAGGVVMANVRRGGGIGSGGSWSWTTHYSYGWPVIALHESVSEGADQTGKWAVWNVERRWNATGVAVNSVVGLLVIGSTVFAVRHRCRRAGDHFQFSIRSLLAATAIAAILLAYWRNEIWILHWFWPYLILHGGLDFSPWYVSVPTIFGLGCVIYLAGWIAIRCGAIGLGCRKRFGRANIDTRAAST